MKRLIVFLSALLIGSPAFSVNADSSSTKITVYGMWLSTNGDCSSPVQVFNNASATLVDISQSPTLGQGKVAAGTYKCLILKIDSLVTFTPSASPGAPCVAGTPVTIKSCAATGMTGSANTVNSSKDAVTGATINCTGSNADTTGGQQVYLYLSRNSACNGSLTGGCTYPNVFSPPTTTGDIVNGWKLDNDIVMSGDATGSFVFNTDGQVDVLGGHCNLEGFTLGFR